MPNQALSCTPLPYLCNWVIYCSPMSLEPFGQFENLFVDFELRLELCGCHGSWSRWVIYVSWFLWRSWYLCKLTGGKLWLIIWNGREPSARVCIHTVYWLVSYWPTTHTLHTDRLTYSTLSCALPDNAVVVWYMYFWKTSSDITLYNSYMYGTVLQKYFFGEH